MAKIGGNCAGRYARDLPWVIRSGTPGRQNEPVSIPGASFKDMP